MVFVRHARRRWRRVALTTVSLVALAAAWTAVGLALAPPASRPAERTPIRQGAAIAGQVTDATTGAPIGGALVVVTNVENGWQEAQLTGPGGGYDVAVPAPGTYELRASAVGYIGRRYGQRFALDAGAVLELEADDEVVDADIPLRRGATITGTVVDDAGQPMAFAEVEALRPQLRGNQRVLIPIAAAQSDESGRYRLTGLPPGSYYVGAFDPAADTLVDGSGAPLWPHTFYPGVTAAIDAVHVPLQGGGSVADVDFAIQPIAAVRVIGRLVAPASADLRSGAVTLSPESVGGVNLGPSLTARVLPGGEFEFVQVPPGSYRIRAQATDYAALAPLFGTFLITVEAHDLTSLAVTLNRGARVGGRVELEVTGATPIPPDLSDIWVSAPRSDGALSWGVTTTRVDRDGQFLFDTPEGTRVIRVQQPPPPWQLDRVIHRGRDITDTPLDFRQGDSYDGLQVILTDQTTHLTGLVTDADGDPISDRAIVAISANPLMRHRGSRHVQLVYPDLNGRYDIRGLPAGRYRVTMVEELYAAELVGRELFDALAAVGTDATLSPGAVVTLDLMLSVEPERLAN